MKKAKKKAKPKAKAKLESIPEDSSIDLPKEPEKKSASKAKGIDPPKAAMKEGRWDSSEKETSKDNQNSLKKPARRGSNEEDSKPAAKNTKDRAAKPVKRRGSIGEDAKPAPVVVEQLSASAQNMMDTNTMAEAFSRPQRTRLARQRRSSEPSSISSRVQQKTKTPEKRKIPLGKKENPFKKFRVGEC